MNIKHIFTTIFAVMLASVAVADTATDSKSLTTVTYVNGAVDGKQTALRGTNNSAVLYGSTPGNPTERAIVADTSGYNSETTASAKLVQTGVVVAKFNEKQPEINKSPNTAVTYTNTAGSLGSKNIYQSSGSYSSGSTNLAQADHVNGAVQNAMKAHLSCNQCTGSTPANACAPANCLLWTMNNTLNSTYVPENQ